MNQSCPESRTRKSLGQPPTLTDKTTARWSAQRLSRNRRRGQTRVPALLTGTRYRREVSLRRMPKQRPPPKTFSVWLRPLFRNDFCLDTCGRRKLRFSPLWIGVRLRLAVVPSLFANDEQRPQLPGLVAPTSLYRFPLLFVQTLCGSIFGLLLLLGLFLPCSIAAPRKIIIDTDPGTDEAMAIMLALNSPELDVRAITVVRGNVTAEQGLDNALRLISLANRCEIPVAAGAQHPLFQKLITAEFWHAKVCTDVNAEKFLDLFISRMQGK